MITLFGTTIKETVTALTEEKKFGGNQSAVSQDDKLKAWARIIITILLIGIGTYLLIADKKTDVAGTILGAVTGYWLK